MDKETFANTIKQKYPQYKDMDNNELVEKITTKYPVYKSQIKEPSFTERVSSDIAERGSNINDAISGQGEFAGKSTLSRGIGATAEGFGAISNTAYEALPEGTRNILDKVGGGIGKGFNFVTDKIADNKFLQEAMSGDPENTKKLEEALQIASDLGIIAGEVLGAGETAVTANAVKNATVKGTRAVGNAVTKKADDVFTSGANKAKGIRESIGLAEPQNVQEAVKSINDAYKTAFVEDSSGINNRLSKLGNKTGTSTDELVNNLAKEGYAPSVEGKLSRMDDVFDDITSRQNEIGEGINKTLETYDNRISLDDFSSRLRNNLQESELISAADLDKSLREIDRITNSYRTAFGDELTPSQINRIRIEANRKTKAFNKEVFQEDVANIVGDTARKYIDEVVPDEAIRNANAEWGRLQQLKDTAKVFDNKPIKTADLGKTLGSFGGVAGAGAIGLTLAGPGGLVVAGLAAKYGGDAVTTFLRSKKFSKVAQEMIKNQLKENPSVLDELISKSKPENAKFLETLRLPAPKEGAVQKSINVPPELPTRRLPDEPQAKNIVETGLGLDKVDNLVEQAKKFDNVDDFVKAQGTPVYHGSRNKFSDFRTDIVGVKGTKNGGIYFSPYKETAKNFGEHVTEAYLDIKNPKIAKSYMEIGRLEEVDIKKAISEGYDGYYFKPSQEQIKSGFMQPYNEEWVAFKPEQIKTKSQLTDIFNKAKNTK